MNGLSPAFYKMPDKVANKYLRSTKVFLYNPHAGFEDPKKYLIPLPHIFKSKADELNGQEIYLSELVEIFDKLVKEFWPKGYEVGIYKDFNHLSVELHEGDPYPKHTFRIINYKIIEGFNGPTS